MRSLHPIMYVLLSFLDVQGPRCSGTLTYTRIPSSLANAETTVHNVIFCSSYTYYNTAAYELNVFFYFYTCALRSAIRIGKEKKIEWRNFCFYYFYLQWNPNFGLCCLNINWSVVGQQACRVHPIATHPHDQCSYFLSKDFLHKFFYNKTSVVYCATDCAARVMWFWFKSVCAITLHFIYSLSKVENQQTNPFEENVLVTEIMFITL